MSDPELGRLRWRCRRGMRELDELLTRYVDREFPSAPPEERNAFRRLLEAPDPDIHAYLLGREMPADPVLAALIARLTGPAGNSH